MPLWISHATPSYTHFSLCTLPSALYLITLSLKFSYKKKWKWIKSGRDHHLHRTIIDRTGEVENLSCFWLGQELGIDQGGRRGKWFWGVFRGLRNKKFPEGTQPTFSTLSPLPPPPSPVRHIHFGVDSIFSTAPTWLGKISNVFRGSNIFSKISPAQALTPRTHAGNKSKVIR